MNGGVPLKSLSLTDTDYPDNMLREVSRFGVSLRG